MKKLIILSFILLFQSILSFAQITSFPNTTNFESEAVCGTNCSVACNLSGVWRNGEQYGFAQAGTFWRPWVGTTLSSATGPNNDHTLGTAAGKYLYVETSNCINTTAHLVSDVYDFSSLSHPRINFWYHMYGATMGTMSLDVDITGLGNWDLDVVPSWTSNIDQWQFKQISLAAYAGLSNVRIRIRGNTGTSFTSDMAVDDIKVFEPLQYDLEHVSVSAGTNNCGASTTTPVTIKLANAGSGTINAGTSIPVSFETGGNVVTETIVTTVPYSPNDTFAYTFVNNFVDLSGPGLVTINSWVNWDAALENDSNTTITQGIPIISNYPYIQDFESGQNGWQINNGIYGTWAFGTPAKTIINSAGSGVNSFVTGGLSTGQYNDNDHSYVQSPCFDFTDICDPVISLKVWWNCEFSWDGMNVTYSTDGGTTWNLLGDLGDPFNWYTDNTINGAPIGFKSGWSGRASTSNGSGGWVTARHRIVGAGGNSNVKIRINFDTDNSVRDEGVAFDDIKIYNAMYLGDDQVTLCNGTSITFDADEGNTAASYSWSNGSTTSNTTASTSGTYVVTMTDGACVVSDTVQLISGASTTNTISPTACFSYTSPSMNYTWTASGTYMDTLTNSVGCDSILTINLTINNNPTSSNVSISACGSYTWLADGNTYTASGTYTFAGTNASGCPQNDTLVLTISNSTTSNTTASACDTYTWSADGNTYTASGTYYFSMTNAYGCTQTDTLNLTINASPLITGPTMVSLASSINLMSSGTPASPNPWSSNNGNVSVSSSGVVQGLILGTSIITYQDLNTCSASKTIHIVDNNELDVTGNSVSISSGDVTPQIPDNTSFANVKLGTSRSRTFKIDYIGVTDLIVSSITSNNPLFTVSSLSPSNTISNGQSATFQVTLTPIANGTHTATITILNSDADQGVFTFDVQGTTIVMPPMVAPTD